MKPDDAVRQLKREQATWESQRSAYLNQIVALKSQLAYLSHQLDNALNREELLRNELLALQP